MATALTPDLRLSTITQGDQFPGPITTLSDGSYVATWTTPFADGSSGAVMAQRFSAAGSPLSPVIQINQTAFSGQGAPTITQAGDGFAVFWSSQFQDDPRSSNGGIIGRVYSKNGVAVTDEFIVNEDSLVRDFDDVLNKQFTPNAATMPDGTLVVTWTSDQGDGSSDAVYQRRYAADGTALSEPEVVNTLRTSGNQQYSSVTAIVDGGGVYAGYVVSYGSGNDLFARHYDALGMPTGVEVELTANTSINNGGIRASVAGLDGGGYVAVWQTSFIQGGSGGDVVARLFNNDGTPASAEFRVNQLFSSTQDAPQVVATSNGGFAVVWESSAAPGDTSGGVVARRFDANGTELGDDFLVHDVVSGTQDFPFITELGNGTLVFTWRSNATGSNGDGDGTSVYQRIFAPDGQSLPSGSAPVLGAISTARSISEDDAEAGILLDADGIVSVGDADNTDFEDGTLTVALLVRSDVEDGFSRQDALGQHVFSISAGGGVTLSNADVLVGGVVVGEIVSDGTDGQPLIIELNAAATPTRMEALVARLSYQNISDDPLAALTVQVHLADGSGAGSTAALVDIDITPTSDTDGKLGAEAQVNSFTANDQDNADAAVLVDGGWVVVWTSNGQDGASDGVYGQRYDSTGNAVGGEFRVNNATASTQNSAKIAALEDGGWVVTFGQGSSPDILLARYDVNGVRTMTDQVIANSNRAEFTGDVIGLAGGGYGVARTSDDTTLDGDRRAVALQVFAADNSQIGTDVVVNQEAEDDQQGIQIAQLKNGNIIAAWHSDPGTTAGDGSGWGAFARLFSATGAPLGGEFQVNTNAIADQFVSDIAVLADGSFVIVMFSDVGDATTSNSSSQGGIVYRRFAEDGTPLTGEIRVNDAIDNAQSSAEITALDNGGFAISWRDSADGDIYVQEYSADGTRLDGQRQVNTSETGTQENGALIGIANGAFVSIYSKPTSTTPATLGGDGSSDGVFQQIFGTTQDLGISEAPTLAGLPTGPNAVQPFVLPLDEADVNAGTLLFAAQNLALSDVDTASFDGAKLVIERVASDLFRDEFDSPDDLDQDNLSVGNAASVAVSGSEIRVNGVLIGEIASDGAQGAALEIDFFAAADAAAISAVLNAITYQNPSNNPAPSRTYQLRFNDGTGAQLPPVNLDVSITEEIDAPFGPSQPEMLVNTQTDFSQEQPAITALADGGWVVTWLSEHQSNSNSDVMQQRYNAQGQKVGQETLVNTNQQRGAVDVDVAALDSGGWVTVWEEDNETIWYQIYDNTGGAVDVPARAGTSVRFSARNEETNPSAAALSTGFVISFDTGDSNFGDSSGVVVRRFASDGVAIDQTEVLVNQNTSGTQSNSDIIELAGGGFAVAWSNSSNVTGQDENGGGVYGRVYSASGSPVGDEFLINQVTNGRQDDVQLAADPNGGFYAVWDDNGASTVKARAFGATGTPSGDEFAVAEERTGTGSVPDITVNQAGELRITFALQAPPSFSTEVFLQRYDSSGARLDGQTLVNSFQSNTQTNPAITSLIDGRQVIVWQSNSAEADGDPSENGVYQSIIGNPASLAAQPDVTLLGIPEAITLDEADVNAGLTLLDADKVSAVSGLSGISLDGVKLRLLIEPEQQDRDDFAPSDNDSQNELGILPGDAGNGAVSVSGGTVLVDGTLVATLTRDGKAGAPLEITFNAAADIEDLEAVLGRLAYANASDDAGGTQDVQNDRRSLILTLNDGADVLLDSAQINLDIVPEADSFIGLSERLVNTYRTDAQTVPEVAVLNDGSFVVIWESNGQDGASGGIYGQLYDANGAPQGREFGVNTKTDTAQNDPSVVALGNGGFFVTWTSTNQDNPSDFDRGIIGQAFNATAQKVGGEIVINDDGNANSVLDITQTQFNPDTFELSDGSAIVVWYSDNSLTDSRDSIIQVKVDANGSISGAPELVSNAGVTAASTGLLGTGLATSSGQAAGHVVIFQQGGQTLARHYDASGAALDTGIAIFGGASLSALDVAGLPTGGYIVAWDAGNDIFARAFSNSGTPHGDAFLVSGDASSSVGDPAITILDDGGFAISWTGTGNADGSGNGVFLQRYDASGARVDNAVQLNVETSSSQDNAAIAGLVGGGLVATYRSDTSGSAGDGSDSGVFLRIFDDVGGSRVDPALPEFAYDAYTRALDPTAVGSGFVAIEPQQDLTVPQGTSFDGGSLEVYFTKAPETGDALGLAAGQGVTTSGTSVLFNGTPIGTITSDGTSGAPLRITFNASADVAGVEAVLAQVGFSTSQSPATGRRDVGIVLTDASGAQNDPAGFSFTLANPTGFELDGFLERQPNGTFATDILLSDAINGPVLIDSDVRLVDNTSASSFTSLQISRQQTLPAQDKETLSFLSTGDGAGQVRVDGLNVFYEGVQIGTLNSSSDGQDGRNLVLTFNANADEEAVKALLENLTFEADDVSIADDRDFFFRLSNASNSRIDRFFSLSMDRTGLPEAPAADGAPEVVNLFDIGNQTAPRIAPMADGGYIITWVSRNQDTPDGQDGIIARRFEALGDPVGDEFIANDIVLGDQQQARVAGLTNGNSVFFWRENGNGRDGSGSGIFAQIFDQDNAPVGVAFQVNVDTTNNQINPIIVPLQGGGFMGVWMSDAQSGNGNIFARVFNDQGVPQSGDIQINTFANGNQNRPTATLLGNGDVLIGWEGATSNSVAFQRVAPTGTLVSRDGSLAGADEVTLNAAATRTQDQPSVASLLDGGWVMAWRSPPDSGGAARIELQRFDSDGIEVGDPFIYSHVGFSVSTTLNPVVAGTDDGGFVLAWQDPSSDIRVQFFDVSGTPTGAPLNLNDGPIQTTSQPDLGVLSNGTIVLTGVGSQSGITDGNDIIQQRFNVPAAGAGAMDPALEGLVSEITFAEDDVNAALQLLEDDGALALSDMDSADFDGGFLRLSVLAGTIETSGTPLGTAPRAEREQLGLVETGGVSIDGVTGDVSVDGTVVGQIAPATDGENGAPFEIRLNSDATPVRVERLIEQLGYGNTDVAPDTSRELVLQLSDGDGGFVERLFTVNITPDNDLNIQPVRDTRQINWYDSGEQELPRTASTYDPVSGDVDGYAVVWQSTGQDSFEGVDALAGVYLQRFDLDGAPRGSVTRVNQTTFGSQGDPDVAGLIGGKQIVVYTVDGSDPLITQQNQQISSVIVGQMIDADGSVSGSPFLITTEEFRAGDNDPRVTALSNGGFAVAYDDSSTFVGEEIAVKIFDANGNAVSGEIQANSTSVGAQRNADIVSLAQNDRFVVVWEDLNGLDGSVSGIFAQMFMNDGTAINFEFQVNSVTTNSQSAPHIAALTNGDFVITWTDESGLDSDSWGVFQQRYDNSGQAIGDQTQVNDTTAQAQRATDIIGLADGGWVVVYEDRGSTSSGNTRAVLAQVFDANGNRVDSEIEITDAAPTTFTRAAVARLDASGFVAVYASDVTGDTETGASDAGIFTRVYDTAAIADPALGDLVSDIVIPEADFTEFVSLDANVTLALGDTNDFSGGRLDVFMVENTEVQALLPAPDGTTQDQLGLAPGTAVSFVAGNVVVDGATIGAVASDGSDGAPLTISFNSAATRGRVEALIEALGYRNISDAPADIRDIAIQLTDGAGGYLRQSVQVTIAPEIDALTPQSGEIQINSFIQGEQLTPDIITLSDGRLLSAWSSSDQNNVAELYGQLFTNDGTPLSGEFVLSGAFGEGLTGGTITALSGGGFVVAGISNSEAIFQVFDNDGVAQSARSAATTAGLRSQTAVSVLALDTGGFVLGVQGSNQAGSNQAFELQSFDALGAPAGTSALLNDPTGQSFNNIALAQLDNGEIIATYQATSLDGDLEGIYLQRLATNLTPIGATLLVNATTAGSQTTPKVTATDNGFAIAWSSSIGDGASNGVFVQRFDQSAAPVGTETIVNDAVNGSQIISDIVRLPGGGFGIAYTEQNSRDGSGSGAFFQQFKADGTRADQPVQVNVETSSTQDSLALTILPDGRVAGAFRSNTSGDAGDGLGSGVFLRLLAPEGDSLVASSLQIDGFNTLRQFDEQTVNGLPQLLDQDGAAVLLDAAQVGVGGGSLVVSRVLPGTQRLYQYRSPDDTSQDEIGLATGGRVSVSGDDVSVDGTPVAKIVDPASPSDLFAVEFLPTASQADAEVILESLTYRNLSDDPVPLRTLRLQFTDNSGEITAPFDVDVEITPAVDSVRKLGDERKANTFTSNAQNDPAIAKLDGGDFVIVWTSNGQDTSSTGIYAQRFDASGNPVARDGGTLGADQTDEFLVNFTTSGAQARPDIAATDNGGFVVSWAGPDSGGTGIYAQRFNGNGQPIDADGTQSSNGSGEFLVNDRETSTQDSVQIASLTGDRLLAVYDSQSGDAPGNTGIVARIFAADGTAGTEFVVNSETAGGQLDPVVAAYENGGFAIVWTDSNSLDGNASGVFGQVYDANGTPVGGQVQLNASINGSQTVTSLVVLETGNLLAVWSDTVSDGNGSGIFARLYSAADLSPLTPEFRVNDVISNSQFGAQGTALPGGGFAISYTDDNGTDGSGRGVFLQTYDAAGNRLDGSVQVNTENSSSQDSPAIVTLDDGTLAVAYRSTTSGNAGDGSSDGVFYQLFSLVSSGVSTLLLNGTEDQAIALDTAFFEQGYFDLEGDPLAQVRLDILPSEGSLVLNNVALLPGAVITRSQIESATLEYSGAANYFGPDSFFFSTADAGGNFNPAVEVAITLANVNDAPGLDAGGNAALQEGQTLSRTLTLADPDLDNRTITVEVDGNQVQQFTTANASPVISANFVAEGTYTVTVRVNDNSGAANAIEEQSFSVSVSNAPPIANNDFFGTLGQEDGPAFDINPLSNDRDPGGDSFSITAIDGQSLTLSSPVQLTSGAIVSLNANGTLNYNPNGAFEALAPNTSGVEAFSYTITDVDGASASATFRLALSGNNDAPDAIDDAFTVTAGSTLSGSVTDGSGSGAVPDNDIDTGDVITVVALNTVEGDIGQDVTLPSGAKLTLNSNGTFSYDPNGAFPTGGQDSFSYTLRDNSGAEDTATVTLQIDQGNQAPEPRDDVFTVDEDSTVTGNVLDDNTNGADSDPDGDAVVVSRVNGDTLLVGQQIQLSSGAIVSIASDGRISFSTNGGYEGLAQGGQDVEKISYTIADTSGAENDAEVTINITGVNDLPQLGSDFVSISQDENANGNVLSNDLDVDAAQLTIVSVAGQTAAVGQQIQLSSGALVTMNSDGSYSYDPNGAFKSVALNTSTSDQVNFTVSDGVASPVSGVLNVTVRGTNDAPQANDDTDIETNANAAVEDNVLDNDEDPDNGAVLRVSAVDGNAGKVGQEFALASGALVTLASDGSFRFDPNGAYPLLNRDDTVEEEIAYTIADEFGASSSAVITVTITGQGIAPDAKNDGISVNEDTGATGNVFANNGAGIDSDANGDAFTVTAVNGQALNVGSPVVLSGGASVVVLATGQVTVATNSSYDSLAVGDTAQETFNYTITDSTGLSDTATATLTINGVNDAPTAQNDAVPVSQDGSANGNVLGNNGNGVDSDIDDGDMLSVTAVNAMAGDVGQTIDLSGGGTLVIMSNGMFSFNTDGDFASLAAGQMVTTSASYTIEDDAGAPDTAVITFTITGANDAPTAADDSFSGTKNSPITGNLLSNNGLGADSDIDTGDSIRVVAIVVDGSTVETPITSPITLPSGAVISINPDGSFSYDASAAASLTPIIGTPAVDGFDYIIEDNAGLSSRARASFSLSTSVNQPVDARDDDITTDANTPIVVDLFANNGNGPDTDPEGDSFEIVAVNGQAGNVNAPLFLLEGGVLTVESDGRARFTPDGDFEDLDVGDQDDFSATYTVRDSEGNISVAAINIFVDGVNDAPDAEDDFFFGNDEEITTGNVFDQNGGGEDSDPEGQMLRVTKVNNVAIPGDGSPITLASGALLTIDAEGNFSYDPNGAFSLGLTENESDTFSYTIVDTGGLESTASVDINLVAFVPPADLVVSEISGDGGDAYTRTGLSYTLTNNGPGPASRFAENVYLSSDAILDENDALVRTFESGVVLEAGESLTRNFSARLPREAGEYFILVDVDPEDRVEETDEANLFASANTITVEPAYTVSLQASTDTALASDTITLSGRATLSDNVSAAPFALVEIDVRDGGEQELIYAFTDADGFWSQDFTPRDGAAGTHTFNARYPGAVTEDSTPEASVEFLDIFVTAPSQAVPVIAGDPAVTFTVDVTNPTDIDLTGIDVVLTGVDAPVNAQIIGAPTELAPGESANIEISLTAPADAAAAIEIFSVDVTSDQGAADSQLAGVEVVPLLGQLELSIDSIEQVIVRDRQEIITFDVTNVGAADTGPVTIALPSLPFLSNGGSAIIDNLMPGESAEVSLIVSPADDLPLGEYEGSIALISEDSSVNLDFDFTALSEATGTLEVRLADDFTYFADGEPLVEDASVTVRNAVSGEVVFESDDVDEILTLEDLPEGFYDIEVSAEDHEPFKATIETKAGETTQIEAFMRLETVRTSWNVQEVAFEDRYEITVEADFLTNVPAPVVVVEPGDVDISQLENIGDTMTVTFTATNHGLIGVQDFELDFGEHPLYDIEVPFDSIPNLEAQSSISFEVTFTRTGDLPGETQQQLALAPAGFDDDAAELLADFDFGAGGTSVNTDVQFTSVPCNIPASTRYKYECGPYGIEVTDTIVVNGVEGNCFGIQGLGEFISGLGGGGGGGGGGRRTGGFDLGFVIPLGEGERAEQVPYSSFSLPDLTFTTCDLSNAADILSSLVPHPVLSCALSILSKYVIGNSLIDILYEKTVEQIESAIEDGITDAVAKIVFKRVPKSVRDKITDAVDPEDFAKQVRELRDRVKQAAEAVDQASSALSSESSAEASSLAVPASLAALALTVPLDAQAAPEANVQQLSADGIDVLLPPEPEDALAKLLELQDAYDAAYITLMGEELFQLAVDGDDAVIDFYNDLVLLSLTDEGPAALSLDLSNQLIEKYAGLIDPVVMQDAIARWNRSVEYSEAGYMNASDVPDGLSTDFASTDDFVAALSIVQEINDDVEDLGYSSVSEYFNDLLDIANPPPTHDDGVCATVRIQINQEAVLTRQAFEGTLEIENLLDGDLTDVQFDLEIRDASGNVVDMDVFAVLEPELSGVSAIDGSGVIDSGNTGTIKFTVIPGRDAAMDEETVYTLGGTLSYTAGDNVVTTPLLGAPITVLPQPELELDYFLQRNVFSDDPFTDEIEPFEPFALGLLVRNEGAGAATDLSITSAQPKIIENEKGLLIDFDIIGTKVNGENLSPSLEVDFGDIAPDSSATATFLMTSSLQGRFVDYDVSFEHVNAFGNVDLSLITETRIHELIRLVKDDRPGADDLEDFLVNGNADVDLNGNPDTLHLSDGTIEAVASARDEMITTPLANGEAQFSAEAEVGWNYFELDDPSNGTANVVGIERSDGKVLTADNFWVTDRTFPPTGNPVYEFRLKVLDFVPAEGPVSYTVLFADKPVPPAADDDVFEILSLAPAQLDVLDNDEPDVRIVDVTQGEFGQVRLLGNGNIEYTPNGQTEQLDSFSYIVEDTQGGRSSAQVSVQQIQPVEISGPASIDEGSDYVLNLDVAPGADPGLKLEIDWGDGSDLEEFSLTQTVSHTYEDGDAAVNITATLIDGDIRSDVASIAVQVNNVAPMGDVSGNETAIAGQSYQLDIGPITDPGDDTITEYRIAWGDGSPDLVVQVEGGVVPDFETHVYQSAGEFQATVSVTDEDGTFVLGSQDVAVQEIVSEPVVVRLGDQPDRINFFTLPAFAAAWTDPDITITHRDDYNNDLDLNTWTDAIPTVFGGQILAGGDLFVGNLGVSGRSAGIEQAQLLDGTEALRFELANEAQSVELEFFSFGQDGDRLEAARVELFDRDGNKVGEEIISANSDGSALQVLISANENFSQVVISSGAYDEAGTFVAGAYIDEAGFAQAATSTLPGSTFALDYVEFTFPGAPLTAGFAAQMLEMEALSDVADAGSTLGDDDDIGTPFSFVNDSLFEF